MSVHRMIAPLPDVGWNSNDPLAIAGRHARFCAVICACCADACAAEDENLQACISICIDCADMCDTIARMTQRETGHNAAALREVLETCIRLCLLCAEECERHAHAHCQLCAEMCRACAADCQRGLPAST